MTEDATYYVGYEDGRSDREADYTYLLSELDLPFNTDNLTNEQIINKMHKLIVEEE